MRTSTLPRSRFFLPSNGYRQRSHYARGAERAAKGRQESQGCRSRWSVVLLPSPLRRLPRSGPKLMMPFGLGNSRWSAERQVHEQGQVLERCKGRIRLRESCPTMFSPRFSFASARVTLGESDACLTACRQCEQCSVVFGWDIQDKTYHRELLISNKANGYHDILAKVDLST
jgi:hypothetical protein